MAQGASKATEKTWDEKRVEIVKAHQPEPQAETDDIPGPPTHITAAELARVQKVRGRVQQAETALQQQQQAIVNAAAAVSEARGQWALVAEELTEAYGQIQIDETTGEIQRGEAGQ